MEENTQNLKKSEETKSSKPWLVWLLVGIIVLLLAAVVYLWLQLAACKKAEQALQKDKQNLQMQLDALESSDAAADAEAAPAQACNDTPTTSMKDNIKAALDSQNTAAFATYFSDPVMFVLAASEKGGNETPDEAALSMEYANTATGPWDFNLPAPTIADYDAGFYTSYFDANTYVGRAASGQVAAFDFDCNGKISKAFLAAHEDIL